MNSPRRTAVASQQTLLHYRLERAIQAAIMQTVFSSVNAALVVLAADFECSAGELIRRILCTYLGH